MYHEVYEYMEIEEGVVDGLVRERRGLAARVMQRRGHWNRTMGMGFV